MSCVADIQNIEAVTCHFLDLVVDFGDQGTDSIDEDRRFLPCGCHHLGRRSVGRQHDRGAIGHLADVVDEDDTSIFERLDHGRVVHDFVKAIDLAVEGLHHPGEGLDGHLYARTEPTRLRQHNLVRHP